MKRKSLSKRPKKFRQLWKLVPYKLSQNGIMHGVCHWCNKLVSSKKLTLDHIKPKCIGGPQTVDNLVLACDECQEEHSAILSKLVKTYRSDRKQLIEILGPQYGRQFMKGIDF